MSAWRVRDFAGPADIPALLDLLLAARRQGLADWVPTVAEWHLHCVTLPPETWADLGAWDDATGRPVAWAFLDEFGSLTYQMAPAPKQGW